MDEVRRTLIVFTTAIVTFYILVPLMPGFRDDMYPMHKVICGMLAVFGLFMAYGDWIIYRLSQREQR